MAKSRWLRWLLRGVAALIALALLLAGLVVYLVGPWPLYHDAAYKSAPYYGDALDAIDRAAGKTTRDTKPAPLRAGWAERDVTPEVGHPMAGYGGRANDKKSTGIHERIMVRALALSDDNDTVVLLGSDLLQTLPNMLALIEPKIKAAIGLGNTSVMYTSSHTHCGPGGFAPGMVAEDAFGEFSPAYLERLSSSIADAIIEAVRTMAPARFAHGSVEVPEYIRNRCREGAPVDATLHVAIAEKNTGERIYIARYSAHATAYGEEMMALNGDFAGAFQRAVTARTGHPLLYVGGAVGSMRPFPPGPPLPTPETEAQALWFENDLESHMVRTGKKSLPQLLADQQARVEAMGQALAERSLAAAEGLLLNGRVDIAAFATPYTPPPAQARLISPDWRLSPHAFRLLGVPTEGRLQAARIGDMLLVGLPYDVSGELSVAWQDFAAQLGARLWVTSFSGAYLGYLSPDGYYRDIGPQYCYNQNYEIQQMGWFGPNQGAYMTDLVEYTVKTLTGNHRSN